MQLGRDLAETQLQGDGDAPENDRPRWDDVVTLYYMRMDLGGAENTVQWSPTELLDLQAPPAEDGRSNHQFPRHGSQVWDGHVVPRVENGNLDEFVPVFAPPLHHYPPEPNQPTEYTIPPASSIHYSNVVIELEESLQQESREIQLRARYEETGSGFLCLECRTIIQREKDMVRHLEKTAKHGVRGFPCTECERSYTRAETLRDHKCKAKKL